MHLGCIFEGISRADTLQHELVCKIQQRGVSNLGYYKWKRKQSLPHCRIKSLLNAHSQFLSFSVFQFFPVFFLQFFFSFWTHVAHSWALADPNCILEVMLTNYFFVMSRETLLCANQRYIYHIWARELNTDKLWRTTALIYVCPLLGVQSQLSTRNSFSHFSASMFSNCFKEYFNRRDFD